MSRYPTALIWLVTCVASGNLWGQLTCTGTGQTRIGHAEGITEPSGDIFISCSGSSYFYYRPTLAIFYNVPVTTRPNVATLSVTTSTGTTTIVGEPDPFDPKSVTYALPMGPVSQPYTIHISNVLLDESSIGPNVVQATLLCTDLFGNTPVNVPVATPQIGLYATYPKAGISSQNSPLPTDVTFANLLSQGTEFSSTRVTEGYNNSFLVKDSMSDTGTRIVLTFSKFPAPVQLFVPDYIAGNDALSPTVAGDIGGMVSPGAYLAGSHTLLLARVLGTDPTGTGGVVVGTPASFAPGKMTAVNLSAGSGIAVYEVIDANDGRQESAQIPAFFGSAVSFTPAIATESISFGPANSSTDPTQGLPVPRFAAVATPSDCLIIGDCSVNYAPKLGATTTGLQFSVGATGNSLTQYIQVDNTGGGFLEFTTSVNYQGSASGWLTVTNQTGGTNHTTLRADANPSGLAYGTFQAVVVVNGGPAGTLSFPASLTVGPGQASISSIVNAASFQTGPLVAGSLATIKGTNLSGKVVTVTFGGIDAIILYNDNQQINVQVPASLASMTSVSVIVTVDGNSSAPSVVQLAPIAPGIFGILNQDNTLNAPSNPAASGSVIQIFTTGLISPISSGPVIVGLANQGIPTLYSGGFPNGLQQVNAQLPANGASLSGVLVVCGAVASGQLVCSQAFTLYTK